LPGRSLIGIWPKNTSSSISSWATRSPAAAFLFISTREQNCNAHLSSIFWITTRPRDIQNTSRRSWSMNPRLGVPVTNIFRDVILKETQLPLKMTAYTPCFRREAGSYGKDVRGLNRLHQFDKVEIVQIVHPDKSYEVLEEMVSHVEKLLQSLELPYRILRLCGGDMSFASSLTYDFEVYSAAQQKWLEVSSVSNFESFQSNRMKIRFRNVDNKTQLVHSLNGSSLALPRIVAALLENNQNSNGTNLPKVL